MLVRVFFRRSVRVAEGARLESVCASKAYRGFESHLLRQSLFLKKLTRFKNVLQTHYLLHFVKCMRIQINQKWIKIIIGNWGFVIANT